jgi:hypothetical protein
MEQNIATSKNAALVKKQWNKPGFYLLDSNNVNSGLSETFHESVANPVKVANGSSVATSAFYHS